jgi:hypothetical protein
LARPVEANSAGPLGGSCSCDAPVAGGGRGALAATLRADAMRRLPGHGGEGATGTSGDEASPLRSAALPTAAPILATALPRFARAFVGNREIDLALENVDPRHEDAQLVADRKSTARLPAD